MQVTMQPPATHQLFTPCRGMIQNLSERVGLVAYYVDLPRNRPMVAEMLNTARCSQHQEQILPEKVVENPLFHSMYITYVNIYIY